MIRTTDRPMHKAFRPYRNHAIVYALIETDMPRAAVTNLDLASADWKQRRLNVVEKGGYTHSYSISGEGLQAIRDYVDNERPADAEHWRSLAIFLMAYNNVSAGERLSVRSVNVIWDEVCGVAGVEG